ncbi:MAG: hypothetical protein WC389_15570 [Lutibacter sp.]|jgi:hypothetical protein
MKIAQTNQGKFVVELSDGKAFKLTEKDGTHLYDGIHHPKHYLVISTLKDYESGGRPELEVDNNLLYGHSSIDLWYEPLEGYEQCEYDTERFEKGVK